MAKEPKKSKKEVESGEPGSESLKDRAQALRAQINGLKKKNIIQTYSDEDDTTIQRVSSGSLKLDRILGKGSNGWGWPRGRMVTIHGPESVGKTSLSLASIAEAQKIGLVVLIDSECVYDSSYAATMGVNIDELLVINPDHAEEGWDAAEALIKTGEVRMIVCDSLDGMVPKAIVESSAEDQFMGLAARVHNRFFSKVQKLLLSNDCILLVISQIREKVPVMYGSPETVGGGRGLKFFASVRIEVRKDEEIKESGNAIGHVIKCKSIKNKTASPQQVTYTRLDWGIGLNKYYDLIDIAVQDGVITKGGAGWYGLSDGRKIQGDINLVNELKSNLELYNDILEKLGMN